MLELFEPAVFSSVCQLLLALILLLLLVPTRQDLCGSGITAGFPCLKTSGILNLDSHKSVTNVTDIRLYITLDFTQIFVLSEFLNNYTGKHFRREKREQTSVFHFLKSLHDVFAFLKPHKAFIIHVMAKYFPKHAKYLKWVSFFRASGQLLFKMNFDTAQQSNWQGLET